MTKYNQVTPEIAAQLQAIVGAKRFFAGDAVKDDFSHDEMPIYGKYYPEVVCEAESTEEVSAILRVCYDNNIPVTPRGAGTGLVGGCVPLCGGVVLCTTRMNKILSYDMNNLVVHIQPGVLLCDLAADALTHGLMYPPDPGEKTATVGGNVSTNAGGMRAVKYGVTRDYVLAMTVVLPDGRVMELGKTVCKTSSGYSLLHLMIGSEGTLGVITELTLKLIPKPEMNVSLIRLPTWRPPSPPCRRSSWPTLTRSRSSSWSATSSIPRRHSPATPSSPRSWTAKRRARTFSSPSSATARPN